MDDKYVKVWRVLSLWLHGDDPSMSLARLLGIPLGQEKARNLMETTAAGLRQQSEPHERLECLDVLGCEGFVQGEDIYFSFQGSDVHKCKRTDFENLIRNFANERSQVRQSHTVDNLSD